jgi:hypothetical protein
MPFVSASRSIPDSPTRSDLARFNMFSVSRFVSEGHYSEREPIKRAVYSPRHGHAVIYRDTLPSVRKLYSVSRSRECCCDYLGQSFISYLGGVCGGRGGGCCHSCLPFYIGV